MTVLADPLPLLKLDLYSSHRLPEKAIEAHCTFEIQTLPSGQVEYHVLSTLLRDQSNGDWQTEKKSDIVLSETETQTALKWISQSKNGPFKQKQNPCDIGSLIIAASDFPLIDSRDCGIRTENLNPSAAPLIAWFRKTCSIEERSFQERMK